MKEQEGQQHLDALLSMAKEQQRSPYERALQTLGALGLSPYQTLELRVSGEKSCDYEDLAQSVACAMLTGLNLYPTSIAVHSTVAALFEAGETVIKAKLRPDDPHRLIVEVMHGKEIMEKPIRVEIDNDMDLRTVAARFKVDTECVEFDEALKAMIIRSFGEK